MKMKEDIFEFLKTKRHENCSEILIVAIEAFNKVKNNAIEEALFLVDTCFS
jgi:hypothetical protein